MANPITVTRTPAGTAKPARESLADILRRRSDGDAGDRESRSAAVQFTMQALTRNATGSIVDVPLEQLLPNPFQPRFQFQRQPLEELAQSLAEEGQLEPVIARRVLRDGLEVLEIVAGARRLEAAKICNVSIRPFPTLRTDVRDLTDEEAERISLIENLQRENLTPLEEGYRYWQLQQRDPRQWSVRAIAGFVHKKKSTVQNRLGLVKDPDVAEAVLREQIPPTAGFHILRLPAAERNGYLRAAITARLTVEQIKADVERRLTPRRPDVVIPLGDARHTASRAIEEGEDGESIEPDGASDAPPAGIIVRGYVRRATATTADTDSQTRRAALEAQCVSLRARIEQLETELRDHLAQLRQAERELASLGGPVTP